MSIAKETDMWYLAYNQKVTMGPYFIRGDFDEELEVEEEYWEQEGMGPFRTKERLAQAVAKLIPSIIKGTVCCIEAYLVDYNVGHPWYE